MALNKGLLNIDGHLDLPPVEHQPHSITDDDLKTVIEAFLGPTARVFPNVNPHVHCHDAVAPSSVTDERMNGAGGSSFSGLSMRCTSTKESQKKAGLLYYTEDART